VIEDGGIKTGMAGYAKKLTRPTEDDKTKLNFKPKVTSVFTRINDYCVHVPIEGLIKQHSTIPAKASIYSPNDLANLCRPAESSTREGHGHRKRMITLVGWKSPAHASAEEPRRWLGERSGMR
jgi:hypothetical protein